MSDSSASWLNSSHLWIDYSGELYYYTQPYYIKCWSDRYLSTGATQIVVGDGLCNDYDITAIDLTPYSSYLEKISIGDDSYKYVRELHIEGFNALKSVTIGVNSFTQYTNYYGSNSNRKFYLRNCPLLKEVQIGRYSFSDYTYSYVENLASLESIVFGNEDEDSYNFYNAIYASFESDWMNVEWRNRFAEVEDDDTW